MMDLIRNMSVFEKISGYKDNWNGYGAKPIPRTVLEKTRQLLSGLNKQPEISATGAESIQLEYELDSGEYLEFEVFADQIKFFVIDADDEEYTELWPFDKPIDQINTIIEAFYGKHSEQSR